VPKPLSESDIKQIADVVKNPHFDVYVGKSDNVIRRVAGQLQFSVPTLAQSSLSGLKGGTLEFSVELSKVNGNQRIEAPSGARPLSDLTKSLGAGALGALGGSGGTGTGTQTTPPSGGSDALKRYKDCLDKASPGNTRALQDCTALLR
jgi:hypothetical protein